MMIDLTAPMTLFGESPDITHVDLYYKGTVLPLNRLVTSCVLLDLQDQAEKIGFESLKMMKSIQKGDSVILRTGWERYRGTTKYANSPWIDKNLIEHLVKKGIILILVDSPGVYGGEKGPEHNEMDRFLADKGAYAVENLVNIHLLPEDRFQLYCFPINMSSRNNAPCRVIADL
jgi:arylformamidase